MIFRKLLLMVIPFSIFLNSIDSKAVVIKPEFHSDAIETHWPELKSIQLDENEKDPGYMRKQLQKFGEMASKIGNSIGSGTSTIAKAIDKVCEVVKTIIPLLTAVCHVGQFKFCAATVGAPEELNQAINSGYSDLNIPD